MRYLLDTDTCIHALKQHPTVLKHMLSERRADLEISAITEAELRTGAAKSSTPARTRKRVENFLAPVAIAEFTSADAVAYARVRAKLERAGTPIGPLDTLIAAQAMARGLTLVSGNLREFGRIAGLKVQNWA